MQKVYSVLADVGEILVLAAGAAGMFLAAVKSL